MPAEQVTLEFGVGIFSGWSELSIVRSLEAAAGAFMVKTAAAKGWPLPPDSACTVKLGGDVVITGFVDAVHIERRDDVHNIEVAGRDLTADLVDCSAPIREWIEQDLETIALDIASAFDVDVLFDLEDIGPPFIVFATNPGETALEAIERACRQRGVLATSTVEGQLLIMRPGLSRADADLREGVNVKGVSAEYDRTGVFREYLVLAQAPGSQDEAEPEDYSGIQGHATDLGARIGRRLSIVAESASDPGIAQMRAEWEAAVRSARSAVFVVGVQGWRQTPGGRLWRAGETLFADLPTCHFSGDLLVRAARFKIEQGERGGSSTELELVRPDAYLPQPILGPGELFGQDVGQPEE